MFSVNINVDHAVYGIYLKGGIRYIRFGDATADLKDISFIKGFETCFGKRNVLVGISALNSRPAVIYGLHGKFFVIAPSIYHQLYNSNNCNCKTNQEQNNITF